MTGDYIEELLELETKLFTHTFFWPHFTVSILSAGVGLEGKNHFLTPSEKIKTVFFSLIFSCDDIHSIRTWCNLI